MKQLERLQKQTAGALERAAKSGNAGLKAQLTRRAAMLDRVAKRKIPRPAAPAIDGAAISRPAREKPLSRTARRLAAGDAGENALMDLEENAGDGEADRPKKKRPARKK